MQAAHCRSRCTFLGHKAPMILLSTQRPYQGATRHLASTASTSSSSFYTAESNVSSCSLQPVSLHRNPRSRARLLWPSTPAANLCWEHLQLKGSTTQRQLHWAWDLTWKFSISVLQPLQLHVGISALDNSHQFGTCPCELQLFLVLKSVLRTCNMLGLCKAGTLK